MCLIYYLASHQIVIFTDFLSKILFECVWNLAEYLNFNEENVSYRNNYLSFIAYTKINFYNINASLKKLNFNLKI